MEDQPKADFLFETSCSFTGRLFHFRLNQHRAPREKIRHGWLTDLPTHPSIWNFGLERNRAELSPSGYGIHWPLIDKGLAAGPLLRSVP
jgi:hypothetical protein